MIGWLRGWWDEKCDVYRDNHGFRDPVDKVPFGRARWAIAEWLNQHTARCWATLAEFAMGWTLQPGGKDVTYCQESARKVGTCYCGKFVRSDLMSQVDNPDERIPV